MSLAHHSTEFRRLAAAEKAEQQRKQRQAMTATAGAGARPGADDFERFMRGLYKGDGEKER